MTGRLTGISTGIMLADMTIRAAPAPRLIRLFPARVIARATGANVAPPSDGAAASRRRRDSATASTSSRPCSTCSAAGCQIRPSATGSRRPTAPSDGGGRSTAWLPVTSMPSARPHSHTSSGTTSERAQPVQRARPSPDGPRHARPATRSPGTHRCAQPPSRRPVAALRLARRRDRLGGMERRHARCLDPSTERRRLWRLEVRGIPVVDLRRAEARDELGVELADPHWPATCSPGARRSSAGPRSRRAGPAIGGSSGARNLVVFPAAFAKVRVLGSRATRPAPPRTTEKRA